MANYSNPVAIGDIGTQVFWFNKDRVAGVVSSNTNLSVDIDEKTYLGKVKYSTDSTVFTYATSGSTWKIGATAVTLADYGLTVTGAPANEDTITVSYSGGTFEYAVPVTAGGEFGGDTESFDAPETDLDYVPKIAGRTSLNDIAYTSNYTKEKYARIVEITGNNTLQSYMEVLSDGSAVVFRGTSGRPTITAGDVRQINWTVVPQFMLWIEDIYDLTDTEIEKLDEAMYTTGATSEIKIDVETIPTERPEYYAKANA